MFLSISLRNKRWVVCLLSIAIFVSCSPRALHEAQDVVSQADSLWQQGEMYRDSVSMAQAYSTLGNWKWFYADEYAHSCYHYGKLLRAQDDPVSAMQVFINATHTPTRDYHILGRVYSNMGDIAHLAGEYSLAYDMYEESANMYLSNGDSLLYYYGLNNMAYELAESGEKEKTLALLFEIECSWHDAELQKFLLETKAELYLKTRQYDSALYYAHHLYQTEKNIPAVPLIIAQAYSRMGIKDSATLYATIVLAQSSELFDMNNALYILTNDDETKDRQELLKSAADRSDTQKLIEIIHGKYAQSVQLLEQDLNRKPDRRWILTLISIVLFLTIGVVCIYLWRNRKRHQQVIHDIDNFAHVKEAHYHEILADIEKFCQLMHDNQSIVEQLRWNNYNEMCEVANRYMYNIVKQLQPYNLSEKETRLCVLILLNATTEQMVELIPYAHSGLGKFKYTTARKLGTTTPKMRVFLLNLLR